MNIIFMGTPDFAVPPLKALINSNHNILAVVTQPDKPKGRGKKLSSPPVKEVAINHNIKIFQPNKIKDNQFIDTLKSLKPDVIVVIAYGKILPKEILDIPPKGCINVHASLLPLYRGAAPIHWSIIKGEEKTGITTMYMNEGLDTGDMIFKEEVNITEDMTVGELHDKLAYLAKNLLIKTLNEVEKNKAPRVPQNQDEHSYAPMLEKNTGEINWKDSRMNIINLIRGTNPWPGAYTYLDNKKMKIYKANKYSGINKEHLPGIIVDFIPEHGWIVSTGNGLISIKEIQMPNSKRMDVDAYIRGHNVKIGTILGKYGSD